MIKAKTSKLCIALLLLLLLSFTVKLITVHTMHFNLKTETKQNYGKK